MIASLSGLFVFSDPTFTSLAIGGIATTIIALLAGLTLVPALLAVWGRKIKPQARAQADDGAFGRLARRVQRHPVMFGLAASAALVAAGIPFLSANYAQDDPRTLPASFESRSVADTLTARFPAEQADPILVIGELSAGDPAVAAYAEQVRAMPGIAVRHGRQSHSRTESPSPMSCPTGRGREPRPKRLSRRCAPIAPPIPRTSPAAPPC